MYDEIIIDKKLQSKINDKLFAKSFKNGLNDDGFKKNKAVNEVLDKSTVMTLFNMIRSNILSYVNGAVKAGKESVVFWGVGPNNYDIALKIYLVSTSNFKSRMLYMEGDPRFSRIKKNTRNIVHLWAKKEFKNYLSCHDCGISVPKPIYTKNNVLAMEFIGQNGTPEKTLLESVDITIDDYNQAIDIIVQLYKTAKLVHGDFSAYNVFKTHKGLILFDLGSAVDLRHPRSKEFLYRDIDNITKFFAKRGLTVKNPIDVYKSVIA